MAKTIGYVRPGVYGSDIDSQAATLIEAGAETISVEGALTDDADKPVLHRVFEALSTGDTLVVASLDRLAHTPTELFYLLDEIMKRGAILKSLRENLTLEGENGLRSPHVAHAPHAPSAPDDSSFIRHLGILIDFERAILKEWQRKTIGAAKQRREIGTSRRRR